MVREALRPLMSGLTLSRCVDRVMETVRVAQVEEDCDIQKCERLYAITADLGELDDYEETMYLCGMYSILYRQEFDIPTTKPVNLLLLDAALLLSVVKKLGYDDPMPVAVTAVRLFFTSQTFKWVNNKTLMWLTKESNFTQFILPELRKCESAKEAFSDKRVSRNPVRIKRL